MAENQSPGFPPNCSFSMTDYQGRVKTGFFPQHAYSGAMRVGSHQPRLPLSVTDAGAMSGGQEGARLDDCGGFEFADVPLPSQLGIHAIEFSKYFSVCFLVSSCLGVLVRTCWELQLCRLEKRKTKPPLQFDTGASLRALHQKVVGTMLGSYGIHLLLGEVVLVGGWGEGFPLVFTGL